MIPAGKDAGQHVHHHAQACALVAADCGDDASQAGDRVRRGPALAIEKAPGLRDRLPFGLCPQHLPQRHRGEGHIEHQGRRVAAGHGEGHRVVAQAPPASAKGREGGDAGGGAEGDEALRRRQHGIVGAAPPVVRVDERADGEAGLPRFRDRHLHGAHADELAQAVVAIDPQRGRRLLQDA